MRGWVGLALAGLVLAGVPLPALAQTCHDWDGDVAEAGFTCPAASDCEDQSWQRHPGALEVCDGLDNDCDGGLDIGCDRWCDEPTRYQAFKKLEMEDLDVWAACVTLTDRGFLAVGKQITGGSSYDPDSLLYARAYDRLAVPWGPDSAIGEPDTVSPAEQRCEIAGAGNRALVVYQDGRTRNQETFRLKARLVDDLGRPIGAGPLDLSSTFPTPTYPEGCAPWIYHDVVWDGERFVAFWIPACGGAQRLVATFVERDGSLSPLGTRVVTDNVDGRKNMLQEVSAVWTGDHFLVVVSVDSGVPPDKWVLNVTRDGTLVSNQPIDTTIRGISVACVLGGDRLLVSWGRSGPTESNLWVAFCDLDGNYLSTPGVIHVLTDDNTQGPTPVLSWSGEMFGVGFTPWSDQTTSYFYRWFFARVLPDGTVLDPGGVVLDEGINLRDVQELLWAGDDFWWFAWRTTARLVRERIVCSCQDQDGDMFDACTGLDCDDRDPLTNPSALEVCRGLRDEDCDGLVDCDDTVDCPGGPGPPEVTDLVWGDGEITWSAVPGAERYDLARGLLRDVRRRGDLLEADCAGLELGVPAWVDDGRIAPPGEVLWYLVRPEGAPCALGSWGQGTAPREVTACR